jgi:phospholipid/cholesterol/gamma-HCH transport system permease protein
MSAVTSPPEAQPGASAQATLQPGSGEVATVRLAGPWALGSPRPDAGAIAREIRALGARRALVDAGAVEEWDTALLTWLRSAGPVFEAEGVTLDRSRLPRGIAGLLQLAEVVVESPPAAAEPPAPFLARVGARAAGFAAAVRSVLAYLGRVALGLARLATLRARFRAADLQRLLQQAGADAVPITTLVSVIVGAILAFVGAVQLRMFGADLYVADLVGVAMVREMGAMIVGIIMAGRTGAAYAAQLATMKVTEELDALKTSGISTIDFLVVPRIVALFVMMPFLCLYAIVLGILGGGLVGVGMLGLARQMYFTQTLEALTTADLWGGLFRGLVYGLLIGLVGCRRGLEAGSDAGAVGQATTSAVVNAIVAIVVADGVLAVLFDALGI